MADFAAFGMQADSGAVLGLSNRYLTFWVDSQLYGLPIADVTQILREQKITPMPNYPGYAKGIIHVRGTVLAVIDVRALLGKPEAPFTDKTCFITVECDGSSKCLLVDSVEEVLAFAEQEISPPPPMFDSCAGYLSGVAAKGGRTILLVNTSALLAM